jgi:ubiquinone/menaquinone biosynthesis C-methylase UbiE
MYRWTASAGARLILNESMRAVVARRRFQGPTLTASTELSPRPYRQPQMIDDPYIQDVRSAWAEFLATLPHDARILDIGINNHVPALVAADMATSRNRAWTIDVIDPAGSDAQRSAYDQTRIDRITFHKGEDLNRLPFAEGAFDAACGHHTLEFTDTATALGEIRRLLKPGAEAQFLLHHADSPVLASARLSLQEADMVFVRTKAFRRLHRLVSMQQIVPGTTERATEELRAAIRMLKQALEGARARGGGRVLGVALDSIQQLLAARRKHRPEATGLAVDRAELELRASVRRLSDLVMHARDDAAMREIEIHATKAGFDQIERSVHVGRNGQPIAWQLLLHRP